jgi:hypothetical protein
MEPITMSSAANDPDFLTWSEGTFAIEQQTGRHHASQHIARAVRRLGLVVIDASGREGMTSATAAKLANHYLSSGGYFTPNARSGIPSAAA